MTGVLQCNSTTAFGDTIFFYELCTKLKGDMEFTAEMIAAHVNGDIVGDAMAKVHTFSKIEEAMPGSITFLANPLYTPHLYDTKASIVLVRRDFVPNPEKTIDATLIKVDDPYQTLSSLLTLIDSYLNPQPTGIEQPSFISEGVSLSPDCYIGAFAYIGKGVKIGTNVKIYPQVYIGHDCEIGDNTIIYPGAKIYHGCKIGKNCIIHAGAVIGADGFGFAPTEDKAYKKIPQIGAVVISDEVEIGANTTVDRATMGVTTINKGVKLDNLIQIAHNVEVGEHTVIAAQTGVAGSAKIGSHGMIGGQVGVAGHIHIGDNVTVGAQTGIPGNVESNSRIMGYPAVNAGEFARNAVLIKRLSDLFKRVSTIEKQINQDN